MPPSYPSLGLLTAIDRCERRVIEALQATGPTRGWAAWHRELAATRLQCVGDAAALGAILDELEHLAAVADLRHAKAPSMAHLDGGDLRFGYGLVTVGERSVVMPAFALLLRRHGETDPRRVAEQLPGLSLADASLWQALTSTPAASPRALALRWLQSPARRLAWNLGALHELASADLASVVGETDAPRKQDDVEAWPALHHNVPYAAAEPLRHSESVIRALRTLAAPSWYWSRSHALTALLARAAITPEYTAGGLRIDLREELPARIGAALDVPDDEALLLLELELLRVAITLAPGEPRGDRVFALARWLGYILARSPFHANDPAVLATHLSSARPDASSLDDPRREDSVTHPRRLLAMLGDAPAAWREFGIVVGAAAHYLGPVDAPRLIPGPVTLLDALHRTASRPLTDRERDAEAASQAGASVDDPKARHLATPWIARAVLHRTRTPWLPSLSVAGLEDVLQQVSRAARRYAWVLESLWQTPRQFGAEARRALAAWWTKTDTSPAIPEHVLALVASTMPHEVIVPQEERVLGLLARSHPEWRAFAAFTLAQECRYAGLPEHERHVVKTFDLVASDESLSIERRVRALEWWVRLIQGDRTRLTPTETRRLGEFAAMPWVRGRARLSSELSILGIDIGARSRETKR